MRSAALLKIAFPGRPLARSNCITARRLFPVLVRPTNMYQPAPLLTFPLRLSNRVLSLEGFRTTDPAHAPGVNKALPNPINSSFLPISLSVRILPSDDRETRRLLRKPPARGGYSPKTPSFASSGSNQVVIDEQKDRFLVKRLHQGRLFQMK